MKEHLKQLLIRSFDDNLTQKEQDELQKGFADFPELVQEQEALSLVRNALQKQSYSFHYGFSEKIMHKIEASQFLSGQNLQDYFVAQLNTLFLRWIMPVGTVAIAIIVITLYFTEGSASVNTITGVNDLSFNDAITLSIYNYK
jgi:hypothetical protein